MIVVGLMGAAGSGKNTVGDYLNSEYGFAEELFAWSLKQAVQTIFCIPDDIMFDRVKREEPLFHWPGWTVRTLLQFVGTELFRNQVDRDVWVKSLALRVKEERAKRASPLSRQPPMEKLMITDVRFPNELDALSNLIDDAKSHSIKVVRPGVDGKVIGIKNHESETHDMEADFTIVNDGTIENLWEKVDKLMEDLGIEPYPEVL